MSDVKGGGWKGGGDSDGVDPGLVEYLNIIGKNGVVIDGVVAWIDVQQDGASDEIWKAQAGDKYTADEIENGKKALWDAAEQNLGETLPKRKGNNKTSSDIEDIHKALLKLKCAHALPLILASSRMVARAPVSRGIPVDADNGDIVNRITALESSMSGFMKQQNEQIKFLTNTVGSLGQSGSGSLPNPLLKKVHTSKLIASTENVESPNKRKRPDENEKHSEVVNDSAIHPSGLQSYAGAAAIQPAGFPGIQKLQSQSNQPGRRRPSIMFGTARTGKDDSESLLAADVCLVASGVSKEASADQLKDFVASKGISVISVERLISEKHPETRTNTFKVVVKASDYEKAMNPDVWPYRVGVRHFKARRNQGMSWQEQSNQSGEGQVNRAGNGMAGHGHGNHQSQNRPQRVPSQQRERGYYNLQHTPSFSLDLHNKYQVLTDQNKEDFVFN